MMAEIIHLSDHRATIVVERVRLDGAAAVVMTLRDGDGDAEVIVWDDLSSKTSVEDAMAYWAAAGCPVVDLRTSGRC